MADPLSPCIAGLLFLLFSAMIHALLAVLPGVDAGDFRSPSEQGDVHAQRVLRLLGRLDGGYGEIRMTAALLFAGALSSFAWALKDIAASALGASPFGAFLLLCAALSLPVFALASVVPGGFAAHSPDAALKRVALPSEVVIVLLSPLTRLGWLLGKLLLKPFGIEPARAGEHVTEEEILQMVDIGEEKGTIESDEKEMIENIFEFNNMNAEDCMIHRKDITAIDAESSEDEILQIIAESGLSRFPVFEDTIDNIIGILTSRDFLLNRCQANPQPFRALIRPAHFVPESVRTDVLFKDMQERKQHMAIVIDEYGGTSGLITLEDLLEEIVGNIYDEFDPKEEQEITPLPDGRWQVSGSVDLETLGKALDIELPLDEEYDTLGGLVFSQLTEIPADGARPVVECCGLRVSVTEIADRRIEWAIVEKLPKDDGDANSAN